MTVREGLRLTGVALVLLGAVSMAWQVLGWQQEERSRARQKGQQQQAHWEGQAGGAWHPQEGPGHKPSLPPRSSTGQLPLGGTGGRAHLQSSRHGHGHGHHQEVVTIRDALDRYKGSGIPGSERWLS